MNHTEEKRTFTREELEAQGFAFVDGFAYRPEDDGTAPADAEYDEDGEGEGV